MNFSKSIAKLKKNRFFTYGLPFLTFVVGSSFVMANLTDIRYMAHKYVHKSITPDAAEKAKKSGLKLIGQSSFEEEYDKMKKTLDIDNWENIRGPRDYEKPSEQFLKQVESLKEKNKNDSSTVYVNSLTHTN